MTKDFSEFAIDADDKSRIMTLPGFATYGSQFGKPDISEFECWVELMDETNRYPFTTTERCEGMGQGKGCKYRTECPDYRRQKEFQALHPEIDWENITKNHPSKISHIEMIRKGIIHEVKPKPKLEIIEEKIE